MYHFYRQSYSISVFDEIIGILYLVYYLPYLKSFGEKYEARGISEGVVATNGSLSNESCLKNVIWNPNILAKGIKLSSTHRRTPHPALGTDNYLSQHKLYYYSKYWTVNDSPAFSDDRTMAKNDEGNLHDCGANWEPNYGSKMIPFV